MAKEIKADDPKRIHFPRKRFGSDSELSTGLGWLTSRMAGTTSQPAMSTKEPGPHRGFGFGLKSFQPLGQTLPYSIRGFAWIDWPKFLPF